LATKEENGSILGQHPDDGRNIRLKVGRFGAFLQWGEDDEEGTTTHTLPRSIRNMNTINIEQTAGEESSLQGMLGISLEQAVQYANLPKTVCMMNELPIIASIGPYGPYLKYNSTFLTLKPADGDVLFIDPETAQTLVTEGIVNGKSSK
jgi:DNA topoisomerase-1